MPKDASPMEGAQPASPLITMLALRGETPLPQPTLCRSSSLAILCIPLPTDPVPGNLPFPRPLMSLPPTQADFPTNAYSKEISQQLHGLMVIKKDQN